MPDPNTPRTSAELTEGALMFFRRLSRGLDALDEGDLSAADDLAGYLRTLVGTGNGNNVIRRLAAAHNVDPGSVFVSGRPVDESETLVSAGNLPIQTQAGQRPLKTAHMMRFRDWLDSTSVIVGNARRRKFSWSALATAAGNTTGNHLSTTVPDVLEHSALFGLAGFTLHHYLLRQVGWQVERALIAMLRELGQDVPSTVERPIELFSAMIGDLHIRKDGPSIRTTVMVSVSRFPADVLTFDNNGTYAVRIDDTGHLAFQVPENFFGDAG